MHFISRFLGLLKVRLPWILLTLYHHHHHIILPAHIITTLTHKLTVWTPTDVIHTLAQCCCRTSCCIVHFSAEVINVQQTITLEKPDWNENWSTCASSSSEHPFVLDVVHVSININNGDDVDAILHRYSNRKYVWTKVQVKTFIFIWHVPLFIFIDGS